MGSTLSPPKLSHIRIPSSALLGLVPHQEGNGNLAVKVTWAAPGTGCVSLCVVSSPGLETRGGQASLTVARQAAPGGQCTRACMRADCALPPDYTSSFMILNGTSHTELSGYSVLVVATSHKWLLSN